MYHRGVHHRVVLGLVVSLACVEEAARPASPPSTPTVVRERHVDEVPRELARARCGDLTAIWTGVDPNADATTEFPLEYGFHSLAFHFEAGPHAGQTIAFEPRGALFHADWRRDIISPDCRRVVLLHDRFGPLEVVRVDDLPAYLRGDAPAEAVLRWCEGCSSAAVHGDARWLDADTLEYVAGACGTSETLRVDLREHEPGGCPS